jgi:hypothetical protein
MPPFAGGFLKLTFFQKCPIPDLLPRLFRNWALFIIRPKPEQYEKPSDAQYCRTDV